MRIRMLIALVMLGTIAVTGERVARGSPLEPRRQGVEATLASPAATDIGEIAFSEDVNDKAEPRGQATEFDSGVTRVWASFEYRNHERDEKLSYILRANGEDFLFDDLPCCGSRDGRFAFPLERSNGRPLGGAAYELFIYQGDRELGRAGFGVKGTRGFDENENDNH